MPCRSRVSAIRVLVATSIVDYLPIASTPPPAAIGAGRVDRVVVVVLIPLGLLLAATADQATEAVVPFRASSVSDVCQGRQRLLQPVLRVGEEHHRSLVVEQRVVDARETGREAPLDTITVVASSTLRIGIP